MHSPRTLGFCMNMVFRNAIRTMKDRAIRNDQLERRLSVQTPEDFARMVSEINEICDALTSKGAYLFVFPKEPPKHAFWRLSVDIFCRFSRRGGELCTRVMSPKEFLALYLEIHRLKQLFEASRAGPSKTVDELSTDQDPCCICLDCMPDVILPCLHSFCHTCIQQWHGHSYKLPGNGRSVSSVELSRGASASRTQPSPALNRSQCPICRDTFEDTSNAWQLVECPPLDECKRDLGWHIRRLIESSGRPVSYAPQDLFPTAAIPGQGTKPSDSLLDPSVL
ncbi:hypothetical protein T265_14348 [Opisthorchis viverrini]|uniref:RING-type domain-containing protein n=1 Tax=Opisthorchis viverrini TaxID=6198 RepID=A0A074ZC52_OPIVI|nr:hypothetical protein T265_14348 [Opisthorchis viverrini]KER24718.1 hypothetical protein T265_14348 [Opisthorchis viverrini]